MNEHKQYLTVEYHRAIESGGLDKRVKQLLQDIDGRFATKLSQKFSLAYQWPTKFESHLYNARRVLEETDKSVINVIAAYEQQEPCDNTFCNSLKNYPQYQSQETRTCVNTGNLDVLSMFSVSTTHHTAQEYRVPEITPDQWNLAVTEIQRRVGSHLKHRPITIPQQAFLEEFIAKVKSWVLMITTKEREQNTILGLSSPRYVHILNDANLERIFRPFERDISKRFNNARDIIIQRQNRMATPCELMVQKVLKVMQKHVGFIRHDKEAART